ncbi:dolichol-phosphate mannosyltransferase [Desulfolithobacter dissulfuricans]|uniref:Dolichol-phosphate mannosyltransferase n=1 Tax=Desulfolithobacter dissulfuricans TaxID=2795293 RepID=A0A915XJZ3_9BACT|nr:glycosyltransferase family 2 protein [Desulfolithobacter dissulfuricans]BCO08533.1 dolichol-phosphate mannosyltransferase [Desulfolithobacter dissulfuricans]
MTFISVVLPVHNEAENIEGLIREIQAARLEYPYEIITVDDASSDNTLAILQRLKQDTPELRILQHKENYGQSAALATGVYRARGDIIVTMDGDGQNNPADIPRLLDRLLEQSPPGLQMVAGFRRKRNDSWWRIVSSRLANAVRGYLLKDGTPDTGCGLKVFYKATFERLPFFDHMHRFLPALVQMRGGQVVSVEVSHRERKHGTSHYGTMNRLFAGIIDIMGVSWLQRRSKVMELRIED